MSNIEWTDSTWNPVIGCTPVSPGCLNCYAATMARRLEAMGQEAYQPDFGGFVGRNGKPGDGDVVRIAEVRAGRAVFTGEVRTLDLRLTDPLRWRKPRRVFVNSMSDLFHEAVPFEFIDRVFAVMALCPQHTFQVLTKRPERMAEYLNAPRANMFLVDEPATQTTAWRVWSATTEFEDHNKGRVARMHWSGFPHPGSGTQHVGGWPLPNVWIGTSVEDQARADERIPHLLRCPAAVRFLSCEPLVGAVDLWRGIYEMPGLGRRGTSLERIHWVIVGGESGPNARPCDAAWIRSIGAQCKAFGVACFVKQLGAHVRTGFSIPREWPTSGETRVSDQRDGTWRVHLCDRKGGDPAEWPEDLRVREWPGKVGAANGEKEGSNGK